MQYQLPFVKSNVCFNFVSYLNHYRRMLKDNYMNWIKKETKKKLHGSPIKKIATVSVGCVCVFHATTRDRNINKWKIGAPDSAAAAATNQ